MALDRDIGTAVLWLTYDTINESMRSTAAKRTNSNGHQFVSINLKTEAEAAGFTGQLLTGRVDLHPSAASHQLIADKIMRDVIPGQGPAD